MDTPRDLVVPNGQAFEPSTTCIYMRPASTDDVAAIDLSGVSWIPPYGLVSIAVFAENQISLGRDIALRGPASRDVANYASRMGLGDVISALGGTHNLPRVRRNDLAGNLIELRSFSGEEEVTEMAELVHDRVERRYPSMANAMHQSIIEVGANVGEHSEQEHGYIAAQVTHRGHRLSFAIGDSGVGIPHSLRDRGFRNDADALKAALKSGVTRTDDVGRGRGLARTKALITGIGGRLFVESGEASRWESREYGQDGPPQWATVRGTVLQAEITS